MEYSPLVEKKSFLAENDCLRHEELKLIKHQLAQESHYHGQNIYQGVYVPTKQIMLFHPGHTYKKRKTEYEYSVSSNKEPNTATHLRTS